MSASLHVPDKVQGTTFLSAAAGEAQGQLSIVQQPVRQGWFCTAPGWTSTTSHYSLPLSLQLHVFSQCSNYPTSPSLPFDHHILAYCGDCYCRLDTELVGPWVTSVYATCVVAHEHLRLCTEGEVCGCQARCVYLSLPTLHDMNEHISSVFLLL